MCSTRIGDQWSLLVLRALAARVMRFGEINRAIGDISKQILSRTLKRFEQDGAVKRTLFAEIPPRVEGLPARRALWIVHDTYKSCLGLAER